MGGRVIIMRGVPGSGKSTFVAKMFPNAVVCSADDYFIRDGEYKFSASEIGLAHQACWKKFYLELCSNEKTIVVDNTNTTAAEIAPYVLPAEAMDYQVEILTTWADPELAASRNTHGVPTETVLRMAEQLAEETSRLPPWWNHTLIF